MNKACRSAAVLRTVLPLLILLSLSACATLFPREKAPAKSERRTGALKKVPATLEPVQEKLAKGAEYVLGKNELIVRGRRFNMDCTGTVLAIYYYAGIDLTRNFNRYRGNGVTRLYKTLEAENLLYNTPDPAPGDIIFWDNTYDRNEDGQWNDTLTHTGMVVRVQDGQVEYIHHNYRRGIIYEQLNLHDPDTYQDTVKGKRVIVNSPIRMKKAGSPHPDKWLASHLYKIFAMAYLLPW